MAGDDNVLRVQIQLDDGSVKQAFLKVEQEGKSAFQSIAETAAGVFVANKLEGYFDKIVGGLGAAIKSAADYGQEVQRLNNNLALSGRYSDANSKSFTDLADSIQKTTAFSDDQVLSVAAMATNFSKSTEATKKLTVASLDFAAATGRDANEAAQQLALTLQGTLGREIGRYFPQLKSLTQQQLEAGAAVDFLAARFKGAAEAQANTYGASVTQLGHAFDDFLKSVGQFVTESPSIIVLVKGLANALLGLADFVTGVRSGEDRLAGFSRALVITGIVLTNDVGKALEGVINLFGAFAETVGAAGEVTIGLFSKRIGLIKTGIEDMYSALKRLPGALAQVGDTPISDKIKAGLEQLKVQLEEIPVTITRVKNQTQVELGTFIDTVGTIFDNMEALPFTFGQVMDSFAEGFQNAIDKVVESSKNGLAQAASQAFSGFANAVSGAFAAIGKTLVKGGDVFKAFAGALLSGLGQAAIQLGSFYVLLGLARLFASYGADPTGYELLGLGASLSVLGGVLAAFGDGVTGSSNPATSVNTGGGSAIDTGQGSSASSTTTPLSPQSTTPGVVVNIQGSVFDTQETGLRIVDLINDNFNSNGARVLAT